MEIEEIVCDACHESILRPGPLHTAADTKSTDGPLYVTCGHLYHRKCGYKLCKDSTIVNEYNIRVAQCKHPGCSKRFGENQFSLIEFTTRPHGITQPADSQVTLLQNQLRVATDMSSRVTKKAVDLANEVNTLKARNKQLELDLANEVDALKARNERLEVELKSSELKARNKQLELDLANEVDALKARNERLEVELKSSESRYSMLMDQRVATMFDTNAGPGITPMMQHQTVPSSPKQQQQQQQQQHQKQKQPSGQQQSPQQTIATDDARKENEPKHQSALHRVNPEQKPLGYSNTSQKSTSRSELSCSNENVSRNGGSRSSKIYKPRQQQNQQKAPSAARPRKKRNTGAEEENSHYEYSRRFGTKSYELRPWYPTNFYPEYFTVAARQPMENVYKKAIFAYNILIIGDGHANGIAEFLLSGRHFLKDIDTDIYRRDMSITDLIETLSGLDRIPERIMISIGNFDVVQKMPRTTFYDHMVKLAQLLCSRKVKEVYFLPLIKYPPENEEAYEAISAVFDDDWGRPSHAKYVPAVPAFGDLDNYTPSVDKFGPFYAKELYASSVVKLRELYVPIPARVQVKYNVPMPPPENVPQQAYKHCSVGKLEPVEAARTPSSTKASTGRKKW